jgi:hypothetical protein
VFAGWGRQRWCSGGAFRGRHGQLVHLEGGGVRGAAEQGHRGAGAVVGAAELSGAAQGQRSGVLRVVVRRHVLLQLLLKRERGVIN